MAKELISIVIPVFNEEECLPELIEQIDSVINNQLKNYDVEVVFVDDYSTDKSKEIISKAKNKWIRYYKLIKNSGSHIAIFAGLNMAKGDYAFIMGADLQDPPQIIPGFINEIKKGYKIILGEREKRRDPFFKKLFASTFNYIMANFVMEKFPVNGGDVFLIDRDIINAVIRCEEKNTNIFVLMLSLCDNVGSFLYERKERFAGESKWSKRKLFKLAYDSIITVGYLPLRAIFIVGMLCFVLSIIVIAYLVFAKVSGLIKVEGWTSLLAAIMALGGINIMSVSILGEYLWRNYDQTRKRPLYIIEGE